MVFQMTQASELGSSFALVTWTSSVTSLVTNGFPPHLDSVTVLIVSHLQGPICDLELHPSLASPPPFPFAPSAPSDLSATFSQHRECALASGLLVSSSWNLPRFHIAPLLPSGLCPNYINPCSFLSYSKW